MNLAIHADMVRDAARRIVPLARRTPVLTSRSLDERAGRSLFFKCENFQRGGAFKIRGASNLILSLTPDQLKRGIVAFSSGNHAQATAIAAQYVGASATIVMPEDAPRSKTEATRARGAKIVTYNRLTEDREAVAARIIADTGAVLVPPFDHPLIMAGQGTAALELMEEIPDLDALLVCVGGGGLLSGSAVIAKDLRPAIRIFGVEPELANDAARSLAAGERVTIAPPDTIADGLRTPATGKLAFPIIQHHVEAILTVSEDEIRAAMRLVMERMKIIIEPSSAVTVAAAISRRLPPELARTGVIISGGNVDLDFLKTL